MPSPHRALPVLLCAALTLILAVSLQTPVSTQQAGRVRPVARHDGRLVAANEVLYKFRQTNAIAARVALEQQADADESAPAGRAGARRLRSRRFDTARLLAMLRANPDIEYAEPNYVFTAIGPQEGAMVTRVPSDSLFTSLWGLRNTGQTVSGVAGIAGADISATSAWGATTGSRAAVVGIIDTGIAYTHADLSANIWSAPAAFTVQIGGATITCAAGTHGFNAITNTCDPADDHGHGTHVAGTIGATGDNGAGVTGVNWTASLMGLKFLSSSGSGFTSDAIEAIDFAIQAKARFGAAANVRILSNSWGGGSSSQALLNEITLANGQDMLFVAAAGNDGTNNDSVPFYPANYTAPNVVSVAATDNRDQLASFSNYGLTRVHLGAPGVGILSTWPNGSYASANGTSMATPHVSGAAALMLSACGFSTAQLKAALLATVDPIAALNGRTVTGGRLNVNRAVQACAPPATPAPVSPSGTGIGANPTFTWAADALVDAYQLYVQSAAGPVVFQRWSLAAPICSASTCAWTPGLALADGNYSFSVQARNAAGYSAWSAFTAFTVGAAVPARVTLTAPTGTISSTTPAFTWNVSAGATRYQLYLQVSGGAVLYQRWLNADDVCSGSTCSVAAPVSLSFGTTYAFSVQASSAAGLAPWAAFFTFTPTAATPAAPALSAPSGAVSTAAPAFVWATSATATRYQLYIQVDGGVVVYQRWLNASDVCSGTTCSVAAPVTFAFGTTYAFSVQASNAAGWSPWATFKTFTPTAATPAAVTLTAPSGAISSTTPAFTWNTSATATRYQLYIQVNGGAVLYQRWLNAGDVCGASSCTVAAPVALSYGTTYAFSVQASNGAGLSPWAGFLTFTPTASTPAAATLTAPSGSSANASPAFVWGAVANATRYQLYVQVSGGPVLYQRWLNSGDICSGSTCTVSSILTLGGGDYVAYVQTGNTAGNGPWSTARPFTVTVPTPGAVTPVSPGGQISSLTPAFVWNAAANATRYQLYVQVRGGAVVYQRWLEAADRCSGSLCSIAGAVTLNAGTTYDFTVQAANAAAFGPWATAMSFSTASGTPTAAVPLAPSGTASGRVTLEWSRVSSDLAYQVYVQSESGPVVLQRWFAADGNCGTDRCAVATDATFTPGVRYDFYVQTRTTSGYSSWSSPISFVYLGAGAAGGTYNSGSDAPPLPAPRDPARPR